MGPLMKSMKLVGLICLISVQILDAAPYRHGLRDRPQLFQIPMAPLPITKRAALTAPPVSIENANAHYTKVGYFRILWGNQFDAQDPDWQDTDNDGIPLWIETIAESLEHAYSFQSSLGFPDPYGMDRYYIDVFVGNTGVRWYDEDLEEWSQVTVGSNYYAYTEVLADYDVCYLVVNDDFSATAQDEITLLRATITHELFHTVQRVDYPWNDENLIPNARWAIEEWWIEATATWMEEICQPEANDYVSYVKEFLAHPEYSLMQSDGYREYGASILAGYIWMAHGGAKTWQSIFENAYQFGVEEAINMALQQRGDPNFSHVLAAFWSNAAHPEMFWPDGNLYYSPGTAPAIHNTISVFPVVDSGNSGRFGANLYRIAPTQSYLSVELIDSENGARFLAGFTADTARVPTQTSNWSTNPVYFDSSASDIAYIAIVNVSPSDGHKAYQVGFNTQDDPPPDNETGGCFIGQIIGLW